MMIRNGKYAIEDVLSKRVKSSIKKKILVDFDGDLMKMSSQRLEVFDVKGLNCVCCGIKGEFFAKEKNENDARYHFNLYALDKAENEILMTKDHVIPKFHGGENHINNYQTMCRPCNEEKGSKLITNAELEQIVVQNV